MRCPNCTTNPVTTIRIPNISLSFNPDFRVLMPSNDFLDRPLEQGIDTYGYILDQFKRLVVANLCCFLMDKLCLGLRCWEYLFDFVEE